jgi:hypothetical protein
MSKGLFIFFLAILLVVSYIFIEKNVRSSSNEIKLTVYPLGTRTKTAGCKLNGAYQDKECSPGKALDGVTKEEVCKNGYSKAVRNVPESLKEKVYQEYSITSHKKGEYEVDHIVSLELGGSNEIDNLYPQPAEPRPGFHEKDVVEDYLHKKVCSGKLSLEDAQKIIANHWVTVYQSLQN